MVRKGWTSLPFGCSIWRRLCGEMANFSREHEVTDLALHDKKAQQWRANLDDWLQKVRADLKVKALQAQAKRRAQSIG